MKEWREKKKAEDPLAFKAAQDLHIAKQRARRQSNPEVLRKHSKRCRDYAYKNKKGKLGAYKAAAKTRGLEWDLAEADAYAIFRLSCHYCGAPPNPLNGIDRKDNGRGYFNANCVPCCTVCNYAKRNATYSEFMGWIDKLCKYQRERAWST